MSLEEKYQCHICMQTANKPIVTPCGHLFCWHCIYHWLRSNQQFLTCPLCKSGLELSSVRPILTKNQPNEREEGGVPARPRPFRKIKQKKNVREMPRALVAMGSNVQRGVMLAGYGIFPSAIPCLFQNFKAPELNQDPMSHSNNQYIIYECMKKITLVCVIIAVSIMIFY